MSRSQYINEQLTTHFVELTHLQVHDLAPEVWRACDLGPQAVFGWAAPEFDPQVGLVVSFCSSMIDEQTATLSDVALEKYLDIIEWVCDTHVLLWFEQPDPSARQRLIEDELEVLFPGSLAIWTQLRLAVLDSAIT